MTIKVDINNNSIFDKIMDFLNKLPQNELHVEVGKHNNEKRKLNAVSLKTKGFNFDREESHAR